MESIMPVIYCRLSRRMKAVFIDMIVWLISIFVSVYLVGLINIENQAYSIVFIILFSSSIEPFCVTYTGASIGHHLFGIRIRHSGVDKNLNLLSSYSRFIFKVPIGIFSLVSIFFTKKHQAIHDLISNSIVVLKQPASLPSWEHESERVFDHKEYLYPSKLRRTLIVLGYTFIAFIIYIIALSTYLSDACFDFEKCTKADSFIESIIIIIFNIAVLLFIILGVTGRLYGCRKKLREA